MDNWDDLLSSMQWPSLITSSIVTPRDTPRDTSSLPDDTSDNNVLVTRSPRQHVKPDSNGTVSVTKAPNFTIYVRKLDQKVVAQSGRGSKPSLRRRWCTIKSKDFKVILFNVNGHFAILLLKHFRRK